MSRSYYSHSWLLNFQIFEKVFLGQPTVWDWWTLEASATPQSRFSQSHHGTYTI